MGSSKSSVTIASQGSLREEISATDSSKENTGEDQQGNSCSDSWRLDEVQSYSHPHNPNIAGPSSVTTSRTVSKQYREICPTHRHLVKSGKVKCSVSLSDTPPITVDPSPIPIVNLPSAPSSPDPASQQQASVHWGAVGEHSGVKTPVDSPQQRSSVINLAPPAIPPRTPTVILPVPPPNPRSRLLSQTLVQGVSAVLEQIPEKNK